MLRTWMFTARPLRLAVLGVILASLPIAWYLGSPLFLNQTVSEAIPSNAPARPDNSQASQASLLALGRGQFGSIDSIHKGEGTATIYRQPDGTLILRLDSFRVTNGPDLYVYLSAHPAPTVSAQVHQSGDLELARLKGNIGSQNYELPTNFDISHFKSVVIYCKQFGVVFSTATLGSPTS